ncbi:hypothetical protein LAZ67_13002346 [Cordylochernes scorpioides]|uniref:DUF4817 domain-containing protein n=1 Tax=Cordylochernes scorpioides TaxID=51811 RepID=A0ABY6L4I5_9ARAC|nr:hypothetical protein LAZ67_13002346 [Cordylochernes scorpioides]
MSCYSLKRLIKSFEETGSLEAKPRSGRPSTCKSVAVTVLQNAEAIETLSTYGENRIIKAAQLLYFLEEMKNLLKLGIVGNKSKIHMLTPFSDDSIIIRVGGRLKWTSILSNDQKHPILLPAKRRLTQLIIKDAHVNPLHRSVNLKHRVLVRKYWRMAAKNKIKMCIREFTLAVSTSVQIKTN